MFPNPLISTMGEVAAKIRVIGILLLMLVFGSGSSFSQEKEEILTYEIVVFGLKIGELEAKKVSEEPGKLRYQVESFVKFWFFGNVDLQFSTQSHFDSGRIVNTLSESKTNRGDYFSKIRWNGNQYEVEASTYKYENQKPLNGPLSWCSTKLFFEEPKPGNVFLSEVYGVSQKIVQVQPNVYEITIEGNKNRYFYQSGILEKVVIENPIKNYQIRRLR